MVALCWQQQRCSCMSAGFGFVWQMRLICVNLFRWRVASWVMFLFMWHVRQTKLNQTESDCWTEEHAGDQRRLKQMHRPIKSTETGLSVRWLLILLSYHIKPWCRQLILESCIWFYTLFVYIDKTRLPIYKVSLVVLQSYQNKANPQLKLIVSLSPDLSSH